MKRNVCILLLLLLCLAVNTLRAQAPLSVTVQTEKEGDTIQFANRVICAVWVEDLHGHFIKTLALYSKNSNHRKHLVEFTAKNANSNVVDACTGATIQRYDTTIVASWDGKDTLNQTLPMGKYVIKCEQTSHNAPWAGWKASYPRPLTTDTIDIAISKTATLPYVRGFKTLSYTVFVPQAKSNDASLKSLTVSAGTLTPSFSPSIREYTVTVGNDVDTITISAQANHDSAKVSGAGKKVVAVGNNTFAIQIVAEDGTTVAYTLTIARLAAITKSNDASLKSLTASVGTLTPAFSPSMLEYTVTVGNDVDTITISAQANHDSAKVSGTGKKVVAVGNNAFAIQIVAEDGTTVAYTLTIARLMGMEDASSSNVPFVISPNPANGILHIQLAGLAEKSTLSLYNAQGQKVMEELLQPRCATYSFPTSHLPTGIYVVKIQNMPAKTIVIQ